MKKEQIEIMGLMIIVILIVIGALLYLRFGILQSKQVTTENKIQNIQAINLINALMNIQICEELTLKETVVKCQNDPQSDCCQTLNGKINEILDTTTEFDYDFYITKNEEIILQLPEILVCETGIRSPSFTFTDSGTPYESYFTLC